jgi:hypothetical protein
MTTWSSQGARLYAMTRLDLGVRLNGIEVPVRSINPGPVYPCGLAIRPTLTTHTSASAVGGEPVEPGPLMNGRSNSIGAGKTIVVELSVPISSSVWR